MFGRAILVCIGLVAAASAMAQTVTPEPSAPPSADAPPNSPVTTLPPQPFGSDDPRYSFNRVDDGYLRLDTRTGQVSLCSRRQVGWACQVIPDDRVVLESEIARLQKENGALKKELLSRGIALPRGIKPPPAQAKPAEEAEPSNLSRVMTAVGSMWRRLVDLIADLQRDIMKKS